MKCYLHHDLDASSQCIDCGKALCHGCTNKYTIPICINCNQQRSSEHRNLLIRNSIIMIVLFAIGFNFAKKEGADLFTTVLIGYFFAGIPWGWGILNRITPNVFLFMPIIGWVFYFLVKLFLSYIIGAFVTPFKIFQIVKGLKETAELEKTEYRKKA